MTETSTDEEEIEDMISMIMEEEGNDDMNQTTMGDDTEVLIGFILGMIAMVIYYHFLHHSKWKSRSISTSFRLRQHVHQKQKELQLQNKQKNEQKEETNQRRETVL
ncbi:uncharacterized protein LOC134195103 [Corticium candelabrum]|uniref:uncharacterized protein LOC134195103 n=1 Tax=Corticium candelabrum TaxID=121492 RepID=UPI002E2620A9|nr:uncharacterized protein LOC134195103 [Corticium candelabrum]